VVGFLDIWKGDRPFLAHLSPDGASQPTQVKDFEAH
jgi:hypothetical protein